MKALSGKTAVLLLSAVIALPLAVTAADKTAGPGTGPAQADIQAMQDRMQAMQARMQAMHATNDPQARMALMTAQMQDMQTMMKDANAGCPMASGMGGRGMMGPMGGGMMGHMGGGPMMQGAPAPSK